MRKTKLKIKRQCLIRQSNSWCYAKLKTKGFFSDKPQDIGQP